MNARMTDLLKSGPMVVPDARRQPLDARAHGRDGESAQREIGVPDARTPAELTRDDVEQIIEGIEHFIIGPEYPENPELRAIWQPYIDKLRPCADLTAERALYAELISQMKAVGERYLAVCADRDALIAELRQVQMDNRELTARLEIAREAYEKAKISNEVGGR